MDKKNMALKYQRVLLKFSGEALMGSGDFGLDSTTLEKVVDQIQAAQALGAEIAIVVGGGNLFRGVQIQGTQIKRTTGDQMGMMATVMNALAMQDAIKKMAVQISWGLPFSEALKRFGERIKTPLIQRTTAMVVKASESGGKIADVIEAAAKNVREIKILQSERKTEMKMYLMIIYIAFFVFLAVIIALSGMFLPKLLQASQQAAGIAGMGGARAGIEEYKFIYICTALSQAIGNGIVAGSLAEGKAIAGLRHATIMILITYLVFKLIL